jgi:hypothetical protein
MLRKHVFSARASMDENAEIAMTAATIDLHFML